jgi:hypothetical protein
MGSNVGEKLLAMVMLKETGLAQLPADGVKVYTVVPITEVLMLAGFHVPVTPSLEVIGSAGAVAFWQYEVAIVGKVGVIRLTMVMFKETGVAQLPAVGVNVYVVVPGTVVLMLAGFQVPVIPSFDVFGSAGAVEFWQYEVAMVGKLGVTLATMVIFKEVGF